MDEIIRIPVDPARALVHEQGWQSWSPTTVYPVTGKPIRPSDERNRRMSYRPDASPIDGAFQGEGLLAVDPGDGGPLMVIAAADGRSAVPSIRAKVENRQLVIGADGEVEVVEEAPAAGLDQALARWADRLRQRWCVPEVAPAPTVWCSWYYYFTDVTEADIDENLAAIEDLDLPIDVVQLDDGYQAEIGDWLTLSPRFTSLQGMVDRIRGTGRRAGLWVAPFLVGELSRPWAEHPDWLVTADGAPIDPGRNWDQRLGLLDTTNPQAQAHLYETFATLRAMGIDYFKIDFVYAGAMPGSRHGDASGIDAYRHGLEVIRKAIGDAYLLGCGAPILPSVGLVDAMRISPDTAPHHEPEDGDLSQPSSRAAMITGQGRAFMHGRFWANDADCLIVRPEVEHREAWADHVARFGGLRSSSDRIAALDDWGLERTRDLLGEQPPATFVAS